MEKNKVTKSSVLSGSGVVDKEKEEKAQALKDVVRDLDLLFKLVGPEDDESPSSIVLKLKAQSLPLLLKSNKVKKGGRWMTTSFMHSLTLTLTMTANSDVTVITSDQDIIFIIQV